MDKGDTCYFLLGARNKKSPPTKLYANMQLPFMSFANIISEQTFFFLYRYDRVLTYDICSTMIVFYYQTKILINFFYVSGIRISNFLFDDKKSY